MLFHIYDDKYWISFTFVPWSCQSCNNCFYVSRITDASQDAMVTVWYQGISSHGDLDPWPASNTGLILGLCPANERRRYFVTTSLIGWAQA